ncbi:MAG: hypothetical protein DI533_22420 [Cereibacter sphaeroides]|uniref:DNA primase/polymerase bifunctional N-terminal domain-containing protein n=1 Tax=Cereibacter sphaeroides TaxID=1063 RepID=A0A2W5RYB3_CERSP|nr:MAG: hypothetical protein DI533_22420 [Cereibacter sphaeroides]
MTSIALSDIFPSTAPPAATMPPGSSPLPTFKSNLDGALWWFAFGYRVIPLIPGKKRPAKAYNPWLDDLSIDAIRQHWKQHPDHEVGAVLDAAQFVVDADTTQADKAGRFEKPIALAEEI